MRIEQHAGQQEPRGRRVRQRSQRNGLRRDATGAHRKNPRHRQPPHLIEMLRFKQRRSAAEGVRRVDEDVCRAHQVPWVVVLSRRTTISEGEVISKRVDEPDAVSELMGDLRQRRAGARLFLEVHIFPDGADVLEPHEIRTGIGNHVNALLWLDEFTVIRGRDAVSPALLAILQTELVCRRVRLYQPLRNRPLDGRGAIRNVVNVIGEPFRTAVDEHILVVTLRVQRCRRVAEPAQ